jgi:hypothetical protein
MIFNRQIIPTTLDPVPRMFRACPGHLVLNTRELAALSNNDGDVFKEIVEIVKAEDAAEARKIYKYPTLSRRKT